jgi:hypothetical protein
MRSVFPFGGLVNLRFLGTCRQVTGVLSCGSSERWRSPDVVGPYWLGPSFLPFARMVFQARSASRFFDTRVERGVASNTAFYLPFFDATAEYYRSDESSRSCARPGSIRRMRGADIRSERGGDCASGYRVRHPRVGLDNSGHSAQPASRLGGSPRNRIVQRYLLARWSRPRPGAMCLPRLSVRGRSSGQRRTSSPWPASRLG